MPGTATGSGSGTLGQCLIFSLANSVCIVVDPGTMLPDTSWAGGNIDCAPLGSSRPLPPDDPYLPLGNASGGSSGRGVSVFGYTRYRHDLLQPMQIASWGNYLNYVAVMSSEDPFVVAVRLTNGGQTDFGPPELGSGVLTAGICCIILGVAWTAGFVVFVVRTNRVARERRETQQARAGVQLPVQPAADDVATAATADALAAPIAPAVVLISTEDAGTRSLRSSSPARAQPAASPGSHAAATTPTTPSSSMQLPLLPQSSQMAAATDVSGPSAV